MIFFVKLMIYFLSDRLSWRRLCLQRWGLRVRIYFISKLSLKENVQFLIFFGMKLKFEQNKQIVIVIFLTKIYVWFSQGLLGVRKKDFRLVQLVQSNQCLIFQSRGGQLFLSAVHIGHLFVSRGPKSCQICKFKTNIVACAGCWWPPPVVESLLQIIFCLKNTNSIVNSIQVLFNIKDHIFIKILQDKLQ